MASVRKRVRALAVALGLAAASLAMASGSAPAAGPSIAGVLRAWVAYGPDGQVKVRAVADSLACPLVDFDGQVDAMERRYGPSGAFPVQVCEATMPPGTRSASVEGQSLPVPAASPRRIVVLGDSGCRVKGGKVQACNDPAAWPFPRVADLAAREHPDLVIHVGDYLYRENPCPAGDGGCAGSPWGDNWITWDADFFAPAALLLKAAPWITVRGNHEDCRRSGTGWTLLLSPDPIDERCSPHDRPYVVSFDGWRLAVVDDNDANEYKANPAVVARLHGDFQAVLAKRPDWLLIHHPVRGVKIEDDDEAGPGGRAAAPAPLPAAPAPLPGANATLIAALTGLDERRLQLILSGHIHNFQYENYGGGQPAQLVAGVGGDLLDKTPSRFSGPLDGATVKAGEAMVTYGYLVLDRQPKGWSIVLHGTDGQVLRRCRFDGRAIACPGA